MRSGASRRKRTPTGAAPDVSPDDLGHRAQPCVDLTCHGGEGSSGPSSCTGGWAFTGPAFDSLRPPGDASPPQGWDYLNDTMAVTVPVMA